MADLLTGASLAERAAAALAVPLPAAFGARLLDPTDPAAGAWITVGDLAANGAGGAHAAALGALLELAGYLALLPHLTGSEHAVTHAVATQLIAVARSGERVEARGVVDRRGGRVAFVTAVAAVGGRTVARAQLTKSVVSF